MRRYLGITAVLSTALLVAICAMWMSEILEPKGSMLITSHGQTVSLDSGFFRYEWQSDRMKAQWFRISIIERTTVFLGFAYVTGSVDGSAIDYRLVVVPYWFPMVLIAILPAMWIRQEWIAMRRARRLEDGRCPDCGYDLRATPERCPECGWGDED